MICSDTHGFVFVANTKAASTSIHVALATYDSGKTITTKLEHHAKHARMNQISAEFPETKNYFKFGVIRNPLEWVVSWYTFRKLVSNKNNTKNIEFKDWLMNQSSTAYDSCGLGLAVSQIDILTSNLDYYMDFETLQQNFDIVCDKINIPRVIISHQNTSTHNHYTEYYDPESLHFVQSKFAEDFDLYNKIKKS